MPFISCVGVSGILLLFAFWQANAPINWFYRISNPKHGMTFETKSEIGMRTVEWPLFSRIHFFFILRIYSTICEDNVVYSQMNWSHLTLFMFSFYFIGCKSLLDLIQIYIRVVENCVGKSNIRISLMNNAHSFKFIFV